MSDDIYGDPLITCLVVLGLLAAAVLITQGIDVRKRRRRRMRFESRQAAYARRHEEYRAGIGGK